MKNHLFDRKNGFTFIETALATAILVMIIGSMMILVRSMTSSLMKSRQSMGAQRGVEEIISKLKNIPFFQVLPADSSLPNYGFTGDFDWPDQNNNNTMISISSYPATRVLDDVLADLKRAGADRFKIDVVYMRRDSSNQLGKGVNALIPFTDANSDGVDDYDSSIKFQDQNGDGDKNDVYVSAPNTNSAGQFASEVPNTHLRQVTVSVFKKNVVIAHQTFLLSNGMFSGNDVISSEAKLKISVNTPLNNADAFQRTTINQIAHHPLTGFLGVYPSTVAPIEADSVTPLVIQGVTEPQATVKVIVNGSGIVAAMTADIAGNFSTTNSASFTTGSAAAITSALLVGNNAIALYSSRFSLQSPYNYRSVRLDSLQPTITVEKPTDTTTVQTLTPLVGATLDDDITSTSNVSGIYPSVITLKVDGVPQTSRYDPVSKFVQWITDKNNYLTPTLSAGLGTRTYTVEIQGGDYAGFEISKTWTFNVTIPPDTTPPVIDSCDATATKVTVRIQDGDSGIDPYSIVLNASGLGTIVDSTNIGTIYDLGTGIVTYTPTTPLASGTSIDVTATHWSNNPSAPANRTTHCPGDLGCFGACSVP